MQEGEVLSPEAQLRALRDLLRAQGWALLCEHAQGQLETRINDIILNPLSDKAADGLLAVAGQEYEKGEIQGMKHLLAFPSTMIEILEAQQEKQDGRSTNTSTDPGISPRHYPHPRRRLRALQRQQLPRRQPLRFRRSRLTILPPHLPRPVQ